MIETIDHFEIVINDIENSTRFYVDILRFSLHDKRKLDGSRGLTEIVYLKLKNSMLELLEFPNVEEVAEAAPNVGLWMFALRTSNMKEEIECFNSLGVELYQLPRNIGSSMRAEIRDLNGISIELRQ